MFLFLVTLLGHLCFQVVVVMSDAHLLIQQLLVSNGGFSFGLSLLLLPVLDLLLKSVDLMGQLLDGG